MKFPIIILFIIIAPCLAFSQWHDAHFHFSGRNQPGFPGPPQKSIVYAFRGNEVQSQLVTPVHPNQQNAVTMSDAAGNLIFYSNGLNVYNWEHQIMQNGENINNGEFAQGWEDEGYPLLYSLLALPMSNDIYYMIHIRILPDECAPFFGGEVLYTKIDLSQNNGLGTVTEKNQFIRGCNAYVWGGLAAVRHANGRDWWILATYGESYRYFRFRVTDAGIRDTLTINVDTVNVLGDYGSGPSLFSPDGRWFIDCRNGHTVRIYDFDRCTGLPSNTYREFVADAPANWGLGIGAAVSPNSKYLYACSTRTMVKAALNAPDDELHVDTIAVYDGFYDVQQSSAAHFGTLQLFPDGRIYGARILHNPVRYMHRIHFPNRPGAGSVVRQHEIYTGVTLTNALPYFPNYRLGPVDGSTCDTLGIDNLPLAHFRWDVEDAATMPLQASFTDLSAYEPETWSWNFGDGSATVSDTSPQHTFPAAGTYQVCLTVSNSNGSHSTCKDVQVGQTALRPEPGATPQLVVSPNPARDHLLLYPSEDVFGQAVHVTLFDITGRMVLEQEAPAGAAYIHLQTGNLPTGLYQLRVAEQGQPMRVARVVLW